MSMSSGESSASDGDFVPGGDSSSESEMSDAVVDETPSRSKGSSKGNRSSGSSKRSKGKKARPPSKKRARGIDRQFILDEASAGNTSEEEEEGDYGEVSDSELAEAERQAIARKERNRAMQSRTARVSSAIASDGEEEEEEEGGEAEVMDEFDDQRDKALFDSLDREKEISEAERHARAIEDRHQRKQRQERELQQLAAEAAERGDLEEIREFRRQPTFEDPHLWKVKCSPGQEQEVAVQIMRRYFKLKGTPDELAIKSVVAFPQARVLNARSYIYVEAYRDQDVKRAIKGLLALQYGQWEQEMVQLKDRPSILAARKRKVTLKRDDWVRLRRKPYSGDLARVLRVDESDSRCMVLVKTVPRIDLTVTKGRGTGGRKRKKDHRPPQRLFSRQLIYDTFGDEVDMEQDQSGSGRTKYNGSWYDKAGFINKSFPVTALITDGARPSLDELALFDVSEDAVPVDEDNTDVKFAKGDRIEVTKGELRHLQGFVIGQDGDRVKFMADHDKIHDELTVTLSQLRKCFVKNDHVKVVNGRHSGETGIVVRVDGSLVSIFSDLGMTEIKVLSKDLQMSQQVSSGFDSLGQYQMHDLVQLDNTTVGVVVRCDRDTLTVLDHNGQTRTCKVTEVQPRRSMRNPTALDSEQAVVSKGATAKVVDGSQKGKEGKVLHVYRSFCFLYKQQVVENNGIFVCRARHLRVAGGRQHSGAMGGSMVPQSPRLHGGRGAAAGGRGGGGGGGRGGGRGRGGRSRSPMVHKTIKITSGPYKSYLGIVKEVTGETARVELHAVSKVVSVPVGNLKTFSELQSFSSSGSATSAAASGGGGFGGVMAGNATPQQGAETPRYGSQTPMHGSATPRYGAETPSHTGAATPMHDRSDAWNPAISNEPPPAAGGDGAAGGASSYGYTPDVYAPTPAAGETPGAPGGYDDGGGYGGYGGAYTPAGETPGAAYTPGYTPYGADTPGAYPSTPAAPTPAAADYDGGYGGGGGGMSTTAALEDGWQEPGLYVRTSTGAEGIITTVNHRDGTCVVEFQGAASSEYNSSELSPVAPEKYDKVRIISGEDRGQIGDLLNIEVVDGVVQFLEVEQLKILPINTMVKCKPPH